MLQESTLLAHLVPRLTSSVEDAATDALAFILNKSPACRDALSLLLREGEGSYRLDALASFDTQVTYKDGSRPDMVGYDQGGGKRLLVESKFWATLLEGQASGYFDQLEDAGPGVLLFIAPTTRLEILWGEITRQMESGPDGFKLQAVETPKQIHRARVMGPDKQDKRLLLVSWPLLLDRMAAAVPPDSLVASDIRQLRGLAQREDDEAFQPIKTAEFSPSVPRRLQWLNRLIDDVVDSRGRPERWISVSGLRATPQRDGYGRYFRFRNDQGEVIPGDLFLCVNYRLWATSGDTPLWLWISGDVPISPTQPRDNVSSLIELGGSGPYDVPIYLTPGAEYGRVLDNVVRQVKAIREIATGHLILRESDNEQSPHGEPLDPIIERPDGTLLFPDGSEGRPGRLTEAQQRQVDVHNACRLFGLTGDDSELVRLGIFTEDDET